MKFNLLLEFNKKINSDPGLIRESYSRIDRYTLDRKLNNYVNDNLNIIDKTILEYGMVKSKNNYPSLHTASTNKIVSTLYEIVLPDNLKKGNNSELGGLVAVKIASNNTESLIIYASPAGYNRFPDETANTLHHSMGNSRYNRGYHLYLSEPKLHVINNNSLRLIEDYDAWRIKTQQLIKVSDLKPTKGYIKRPLGDQLAEHFGKEFKESIKTGKDARGHMTGYRALTSANKDGAFNLYFLLCTTHVADGGLFVDSATAHIKLLSQTSDIKSICGSTSFTATEKVLRNDDGRFVSVSNYGAVRLAGIIQSGDDVMDEYRNLVKNAIDSKYILKKLNSLKSSFIQSKFDPESGGYKFNIATGIYNNLADFLSEDVLNRFKTRLKSTEFKSQLVPNIPVELTGMPTSLKHSFILHPLKDRESKKDFFAITILDNNAQSPRSSAAAFTEKVLILTESNIMKTPIGSIVINNKTIQHNLEVMKKYNDLSQTGREIFMRTIAR